MPIGGMREMKRYVVWLESHPNCTEAERGAFLQSLIDDPKNSLKPQADVSLIAAAPEMLKVLKAIAAGTGPLDRHEIESVYAVIAKATGCE